MFLVAVLGSIANGAPLSEADLKSLLAGIRQNFLMICKFTIAAIRTDW